MEVGGNWCVEFYVGWLHTIRCLRLLSYDELAVVLLSGFCRVDSSCVNFQIKLSLTFLIGIFCHCFTKLCNRKSFLSFTYCAFIVDGN